MRTLIIGGGKGAQAIIELTQKKFLKELKLDIECVVDPDRNAPGLLYAQELGIETMADMAEAITRPGWELIIELTGRQSVLERIHQLLPGGIGLIDHTFAHIFWDLADAQQQQERQLNEITALEKEIEKERFFLQSLFDTIPELVIVLDRNKKVLRINESFSRFAGISQRRARGQVCRDILQRTELEEGCAVTDELLSEVIEDGKPRSLTWQTIGPNEAYWEVSYKPVLDQDLEIEAIVGTWHRITEQVMLHREIESAEQRFKDFINSAHDWISIKDIAGRYVIVNPVCAEAFGMEPGDFAGKSPADLLDAETAAMIIKHDKEVLEKGRHMTYDEVFVIDRRRRHYQTVRFPLKDYRGANIGVCTISRDVTEERELRDQLVQAVKLAAVGKLAAGVAHEINNPLTGVMAYAEDIRDELPADSPHREDIEVIIRETKRCRDIVRNLLDFARQESLNLKKTSLNRVVEKTIDLVHKLPQFRNVELVVEPGEDLPEVNCDRHQLQQVILNLLMNASEAVNEHGRVRLATLFDKKQNCCVVRVTDNGPGIPENILAKIFEPFFSTKGTNGLGLAISWGIIERHSGIIRAGNVEGGGAIFEIVLPAAQTT